MEIHELVVEMKLLEGRLTLYEEKYGQQIQHRDLLDPIFPR